jgi:hypothetical protein
MRETQGRNAPQVEEAKKFAKDNDVDLRAIAVVYARELTRWGIETTIIVPGAFTGGTNPLRTCRFSGRQDTSR